MPAWQRDPLAEEVVSEVIARAGLCPNVVSEGIGTERGQSNLWGTGGRERLTETDRERVRRDQGCLDTGELLLFPSERRLRAGGTPGWETA